MESTRRNLLLTLTGVTGLCVFGWREAMQSSQVRATASCAPLLELIDDQRHARKLGRSYLIGNPLENRPEVLAALLLAAFPKLPLPAEDRPGRLLSALEETVRTEFGVGQVVRLDGWILARSEARLCALYAL